MALNDITFIRAAGGLGRPLDGEDHVSGMLFFLTDANLPAGFSTSDRVKKVFSIADVEALGIIEGSATNGVLWYHMDRLFKANAQAVVYLGIYGGVSGATDLTKVLDLANEANGEARQIGVFDIEAWAVGSVGTLQTQANTLETEHKPASIFYAADMTGTTASALVDTRAQNAKNVTVVLSEDGSGVGAALAVSEGYSITNLGQVVGEVSRAKVSESIGWVAKFNLVDGDEMNVPAMATGELVKDLATALQDTIKGYGYLFARKHIGLSGTYFEGAPTSIVETSDFSTVFNERTIDKAVRGIRTFMLPNISAPLEVNANGTLTEDTVSRFRNDAQRHLDQMGIDGEISAGNILIDPSQNVISTSKLVLTAQIVPVGVADQIEINIGYVLAIS